MTEVEAMAVVGQELGAHAAEAEQEERYEVARVWRALENELMWQLNGLLREK